MASPQLSRFSWPVLLLPLMGISLILAAALGYFVAKEGITGIPTSVWIFFAAAALLATSFFLLRGMNLSTLSILNRCILISLLIHLLLAFIFSALAVSQKIYQMVAHPAPMVPTVNLQLAREMELRTQLRDQISNIPAPDPALVKPVDNPAAPAPAVVAAPVPTVTIPNAQPGPTPLAIDAAAPAFRLGNGTPSALPQVALLPIAPAIALRAPVAANVPDAPTDLDGGPTPLDAQFGLAGVTKGDPAGTGNHAPVALGTVPASSGTATGGLINGSGNFVDAPGLPALPPPPLAPQTLPEIVAKIPEVTTPLQDRAYDRRQTLIKKFGGSNETEAAVSRALAFLARDQEADGHWSFESDNADPGENREPHAHETGFTGLGTLCFLAADHTPARAGPYRETVRKSLAFILTHQLSNGDLRGEGGSMYDHAIATLALSEAAEMTGDPAFTKAALAGASFIVSAQNDATGGWRYVPDQRGDTSVLGWQIMALFSAHRLGFSPPAKTMEGAAHFLDGVTTGKNHAFAGYQDFKATPSMSAEALFSRMLLGQQLPEATVADASNYFLNNPPGEGRDNYYYWYYASLGLMQMQNPAWPQWNQLVTQKLLANQRRDGRFDGAWEPDKEWGSRGGRIYATTLACLTLEVYYRYLPFYRTTPAP